MYQNVKRFHLLTDTVVSCIDIIECDAGNLCANGICQNNEGSYMCSCIPGFAVDSTGTECQGKYKFSVFPL